MTTTFPPALGAGNGEATVMKLRSDATRYRGRRTDAGCIIERFEPGIPGSRARWAPLSPLRSLRACSHSPDGFEWGYGGSGRAPDPLDALPHFPGKQKLVGGVAHDHKRKV